MKSGALESCLTEVTRVLWSFGIRFFWKNFRSMSTCGFAVPFVLTGDVPFPLFAARAS